MKKIFALLLPLLALLSCKKEQDNGPESIFRFKANGTQYEWNTFPGTKDSIDAFFMHQYTYSGYILYAYDLTANKLNRFSIGIPYDTVLKKQQYTYGPQTNAYTTGLFQVGTWSSGRTSILGGNDYVNGLYDDYVNINITSIQDSLVSGEFNARLTTVGNIGQKMIITDGVFKNLRILH